MAAASSPMRRPASVDVSAANLPRKTKGALTIKSLVSKKKLRFIGDGGVDLDLSYITDQIIAMGWPSRGIESLYRNGLDDVKQFLERRHGGHFRIWNLVSEREYGAGHFPCEIERFTWADHTPPPFNLVRITSGCAAVPRKEKLWSQQIGCQSTFLIILRQLLCAQVRPACESMESWLCADPKNVAVVHCKAGKGRTGTIIAAYLLHSGACATADEALQLFGDRRTRNGRGVTIPSQARYVRYYALQLTAQAQAAAAGATASSCDQAEAAASGDAEPVEKPAETPASASGVTPRRRFGATAIVTRIDPERRGEPSKLIPFHTSRSAADAEGPPRSIITLTLHRDWDRTLGFRLGRHPTTGRPIVESLREYEAGVENSGNDDESSAASSSSSAATASSAMNSVVPVPLRRVLRVGDELVSVNGVDLSHRPTFGEVTSLLRGALDPVVLKIARHTEDEADAISASNPVAAAVDGAAGTVRSPEQLAADYLQRVASGVGPWAAGADTRNVPSPPVLLTSIELSHLPLPGSGFRPASASSPGSVRGGGSSANGDNTGVPVVGSTREGSSWADLLCGCFGAGGSSKAPEDTIYVQLYGGPFCATLLFDSRSKGYAVASTSVSTSSSMSAPAAASMPAAQPSAVDSSTAGGNGTMALSESTASLLSLKGAEAASASPAVQPPTAEAPPVASGDGAASAAATAIVGNDAQAAAAAPDSSSDAGVAAFPSEPAPSAPEPLPSTRSGYTSIAAVAPSPTPVAIVTSSSGRSGSKVAGNTSSPPSAAADHQPELTWGARYLGATGIAAAGDVRLIIRHPGRKKPLAAAWFNTGCLPLPAAMQTAVARTLGVSEQMAVAAGGDNSTSQVSEEADPPKPDLHIRLPPRYNDLGEQTPSTVGDSNAATPAGSGGQAIGSSSSSPSATSGPKLAQWEALPILPIVTTDVPGGAMHSASAPLLGACYTAAASAAPSAAKVAGAPSSSDVTSTASSSDVIGCVTFSKRSLDYAVKDKAHRLFPEGLTLTLRFSALSLPPVYFDALSLPPASAMAQSGVEAHDHDQAAVDALGPALAGACS